jgi:hypothetical protein
MLPLLQQSVSAIGGDATMLFRQALGKAEESAAVPQWRGTEFIPFYLWREACTET